MYLHKLFISLSWHIDILPHKNEYTSVSYKIKQEREANFSVENCSNYRPNIRRDVIFNNNVSF